MEWVVPKESFEGDDYAGEEGSQVMFGDVASLSEFRSEYD